MDYKIIDIPMEINIPYEIMTKRQAKKFFHWFMSIKDERIKYLMKRVFNLDEIVFSEKHLQGLHYFLVENIRKRKKTKEEIQREKDLIPKQHKDSHVFEEECLTNETAAIAFDIGIYIAEYILCVTTDMKWSYERRNSEQYGKPIIFGKDKYCSHIDIMKYFIRDYLNGNLSEDRLLDNINNLLITYRGEETRAQKFMREYIEKNEK
jgi:hypothetical protein